MNSPTHTETKALVERLRELAEKATPGEWVIWGLKSRHGHLTIGVEEETGPTKHICEMAWLRDLRERGASGGDDANLIVALRNALPQILAALEPLTREPDADEVERVARAIWEVDAPEHRMAWDEETSAGKERYLCIARAATAALPRRDAMREALEKIANHPTGGVGCNPVGFVEIARAARTEESGHS